MDGQVCIKFGVADQIKYKILKFGIANHFINKKRVDNTKFNTPLTVQAVHTYVLPLAPKVRTAKYVRYLTTATVPHKAHNL